jgi:hypothetical protein
MKLPDIAISYEESIPADLFDDFDKSLREDSLNFVIDVRPNPGPCAGIEWFLPTAIIVFIGKSYFDGFLKEAGKDHYNKLKESISGLTRKTMTQPRIEPIIIASHEGKIRKDNPYSLAFSIYAEANNGNRFKLLIPKPNSSIDYNEIIYKFLDFLNDYHDGIKVLDDIGLDDNKKSVGGTILVHMSPESKKIEWLDHRQ